MKRTGLNRLVKPAQHLRSYARERQKGKELQLKRTGPMETGHNPRITPGTHSLLGRKERRKEGRKEGKKEGRREGSNRRKKDRKRKRYERLV